MAGNPTDTLYEDVREQICGKIYEGDFAEGERLPAERNLAEMMHVSRITLRKALELLAEQGLVRKEAGSGNRIALPNRGTPSSMDMIILIAPAKNPFFSDFIKSFQEYGQEYGSMILYAEKPRKESLADSIYRFYRKHLQNVVIWPEDTRVDPDKLKRLRALGMNMVFFDTDSGIPYADAVVLDNERAMRELAERVRSRGLTRIGYVGWAGGPAYSSQARETAILKEDGAKLFLRLPWKKRSAAKEMVYQYMKAHPEEVPPALVFGDRECGIAVMEALRRLDRGDILLAGIDDFPGAAEARAIICKQNIRETIQRIFRCIEEQNDQGQAWRADTYYIRGEIVENRKF